MREFVVEQELTGKDIRNLRAHLELTQAEMARLANVSLKTLERWEYEDKKLSGPIATLAMLLREHPHFAYDMEIPTKEYPIRLWYMWNNRICTLIDVDERKQLVRTKNYTSNYMFRAFGRIENPTFKEYEDFLESRCFPRTTDKIKLLLKELDLPFYEPFLIIEKTEGRMAEDDFWIRIER